MGRKSQDVWGKHLKTPETCHGAFKKIPVDWQWSDHLIKNEPDPGQKKHADHPRCKVSNLKCLAPKIPRCRKYSKK